MLLTVADVVLRSFGRPLVGTFELVGLGGAMVAGFAIPRTSWLRSHIYVDFFIARFSPEIRAVFNIATRIMGIVLFILIGINLYRYAYDLLCSGEVTLTCQLPFYPIAYGMAASCFVECLVLVADIVKILGGEYE